MRNFELTTDWDIQLDPSGNIKLCDGAYAVAQEVANKVRLFTNDAYYEPNKGIPHFVVDLGQRPMESVVRSRIKQAALSVTQVASVKIFEIAVENRVLTGRIELTLKNGTITDVNF